MFPLAAAARIVAALGSRYADSGRRCHSYVGSPLITALRANRHLLKKNPRDEYLLIRARLGVLSRDYLSLIVLTQR